MRKNSKMLDAGTKWYVSRQHQYYGRQLVVEVAMGGINYAGSDMLVKRYKGEGEEYTDPVEAVEAAIDICREWRKVAPKGNRPVLAIGATGGMLTEIDSYYTFVEARKHAKELFDRLPRCDRCGKPLGRVWYYPPFDNDIRFCSEYCAEEYQREEYPEDEDASYSD